jgi:hypothetical protein
MSEKDAPTISHDVIRNEKPNVKIPGTLIDKIVIHGEHSEEDVNDIKESFQLRALTAKIGEKLYEEKSAEVDGEVDTATMRKIIQAAKDDISSFIESKGCDSDFLRFAPITTNMTLEDGIAGQAEFDGYEGISLINFESEMQAYEVAVHELLHLAGFKSYDVSIAKNAENEEKKASFSLRRNGLQIELKDGREIFRALNEGFVENDAITIVKSNENSARKRFGLDPVGDDAVTEAYEKILRRKRRNRSPHFYRLVLFCG